jgi:hypothetical protein
VTLSPPSATPILVERALAEIQPDRRHVQGIVTLGLLESAVEILAAPLLESVVLSAGCRCLHPVGGVVRATRLDSAIDRAPARLCPA